MRFRVVMRAVPSLFLLCFVIPAPAQAADVGEKISFVWSVHVAEDEVAEEVICIGQENCHSLEAAGVSA